ncbi:MAG: DUF3310 domain-containing protein [Fusobacterium periodonticum]|nr:DUF3310 domain-containing protein [Fusobacterium periodonticum]
MENKVDNINNANHYQVCGFNSIKIIEKILGKDGFVAFCLGNILKYLIRAEKKNKLEDYKKASKYLEWTIERCNGIEHHINIKEMEEELGVTWNKIITEIAKDLNVDDTVELDAIFRNIFDENYEIAREILDDFIKEYGVDTND